MEVKGNAANDRNRAVRGVNRGRRRALPKAENVIPLAAIVAVLVLDGWAIAHGINGVALKSSVAVLGGIAGYQIRKRVSK